MRVRAPFGLLFGLCVLLASACNRTEEPHSSGDAQAAPPPPLAAAATEKSAPSSNKAACVIPMTAEPPRRAPNALHCPPDPQGPGELAHGYVVFTDAPGSPRLNVELARTEPEKERGLMYRSKLPDAQGMLFSWGGVEEPRMFWMRNTCIPLDMMFIARDGTITGIWNKSRTLNDEPRGRALPGRLRAGGQRRLVSRARHSIRNHGALRMNQRNMIAMLKNFQHGFVALGSDFGVCRSRRRLPVDARGAGVALGAQASDARNGGCRSGNAARTRPTPAPLRARRPRPRSARTTRCTASSRLPTPPPSSRAKVRSLPKSRPTKASSCAICTMTKHRSRSQTSLAWPAACAHSRRPTVSGPRSPRTTGPRFTA